MPTIELHTYVYATAQLFQTVSSLYIIVLYVASTQTVAVYAFSSCRYGQNIYLFVCLFRTIQLKPF